MRIVATIILFLIISFLLSCDESPTENDGKGFNVSINVFDKNSNKLSNVDIAIWNKIQNINSLIPKALNLSEIQATTSIKFSLKQSCLVSLKLYDLEDNVFATIINNKTLNAGVYTYQYFNNNNIGTGVFKCKIRAKEDSLSNSVIFSDSIYSIIFSPDPEIAHIGSTNDKGEFSTSNKLLFPNLYELPELIRTSEAGPQAIGKFNISNDIIIALTNESETRYYEEIILDESNIFNLVWDKGSTEYPNWYESQNYNNLSKVVDDSSAYIPIKFDLAQNYPNPFN